MWSVVTESPKMPSARALRIGRHRRRLHRKSGEEGRLGDVGRFIPGIDLAGGRRDRVPQRVLLGEVAVEPAVGRRIRRVLHHRADFLGGRPHVAQIDRRLPSRPVPSGSVERSMLARPAMA